MLLSSGYLCLSYSISIFSSILFPPYIWKYSLVWEDSWGVIKLLFEYNLCNLGEYMNSFSHLVNHSHNLIWLPNWSGHLASDQLIWSMQTPDSIMHTHTKKLSLGSFTGVLMDQKAWCNYWGSWFTLYELTHTIQRKREWLDTGTRADVFDFYFTNLWSDWLEPSSLHMQQSAYVSSTTYATIL